MTILKMLSIFKGLKLIIQERYRQRFGELYSEKHDLLHTNGELANYACCYALDPMGGDASNITKTLLPQGFTLKLSCNGNTMDDLEGRIKDLVKAGALIAAEIDRLLILKDGI